MSLSRSFSDSVLSVQCYIILWIARRVLCGESFLGHSICPHVNCCHGDQLRSYCLVKPLDLSPTSGSAIVQSLSDRQSESTMLSGSDLPELVLLFVAYICCCFSKPFWLVALNGTLNLLNQILKQHSSWFSTGMHFQFEILLLLPKETLWHYINIRTGKRRLSYACLLFCCNRLVILKQVYPRLFFIPALRATSTRLCVHLWCLCWIIKAREMFQRSKKIPVSEERRMREQVRNAEWERQRERGADRFSAVNKRTEAALLWVEPALCLAALLSAAYGALLAKLSMASCRWDPAVLDWVELTGYFALKPVAVWSLTLWMFRTPYDLQPWETPVVVFGVRKRNIIWTPKGLLWDLNPKILKVAAIFRGKRGNRKT